MRSGTAGISDAADGAQASDSTSAGRCVAAQAGPVWAAAVAASGTSAAKSAAVRVNLMAPSTGAP